MNQHTVNLGKFNNSTFDRGAGIIKQWVWYFTNIIFFTNRFQVFSWLKVFLLRAFGAKVGKKVVIKPCVNIKFPWKLKIGNQSWIGENVWIDNLCEVEIGSNCCISQGAMLITGNHDFTNVSFRLIVSPIRLADGSWVGAKAIVCPGVILGSHSILTVGSVATSNLGPYEIHQGNPASFKKMRAIEDEIII